MPMTITMQEAPPATPVVAVEPTTKVSLTLREWEKASGITARTYDKPHQQYKTIHAPGGYLGVDCPLGHPHRQSIYDITDREVMFADERRVLFKPTKLKLDLTLHPGEYALQLVRERGKPLEPIKNWLWDEARKIKTKTPTRVQLENARRVIEYWIGQRDRLLSDIAEEVKELRETQLSDAMDVLVREATRTKREDILALLKLIGDTDDLEDGELDPDDVFEFAKKHGNVHPEALMEMAEQHQQEEGDKLFHKQEISGAQLKYHNADVIAAAIKRLDIPPWSQPS